MDQDQSPTSPHPTPGGLVRLQVCPADLIAWVGPAWAVACGSLASGQVRWQLADGLLLAMLILLVDGGWITLWSAMKDTDWATPIRRWARWRRRGKPVLLLPYTLQGSPGSRLFRWLGDLRSWWQEVLWPANGAALSAMIAALATILILGAWLGPELLSLSAAALATMQLGLIWKRRRGTICPGWDGVLAIALPWLVGHVAFAPLTLPSTGLALAFTLAWVAFWRTTQPWGRVLGGTAQLLAGALVVGLDRPLAAAVLVLLLVPQWLLFPWMKQGLPTFWFVRYAGPWLMAAMLLAAWAA